MEAQSNSISEAAGVRYARVWADFTASVHRGEVNERIAQCRMACAKGTKANMATVPGRHICCIWEFLCRVFNFNQY